MGNTMQSEQCVCAFALRLPLCVLAHHCDLSSQQGRNNWNGNLLELYIYTYMCKKERIKHTNSDEIQRITDSIQMSSCPAISALHKSTAQCVAAKGTPKIGHCDIPKGLI